MRYIAYLQENDVITEHYVCKRKDALTSKTNKPYLSLKLADKTGEIDAKIWEPQVNIGPFEAGDYVKAEGTIVLYQQQLQFRVARLRKSVAGEYDKRDYISATKRDLDEMQAELSSRVDSVADPFLNALLKAVFADDETVRAKMREHSAAKSMHHAFLGGLLEHTLSVTKLCDFMAAQYPAVNRDLLVSCALLHDVCKVFELSDLPTCEYTDDGELLGHIVMVSELVSRKADAIAGFPPTLLSLVKHCLLAHHGEYAYGSPKLPKTIEAMLLHACDNLDAKTQMFTEALDKHKGIGEWLGWSRVLERNIRTSNYDE